MLSVPADVRLRTTAAAFGRWLEHAADAPAALPLPEHIHQTPAWASAWERLRTEPVLAHRHLLLSAPSGAPERLLSFYLIDGSPFWTSYEQPLGMAPVWDGPVIYGPSMYAEYGGLGVGATAAQLAAAVDGGRELMRAWDAQALVIPNLGAAEAARWQQVRPADAAILCDLTHHAPLPILSSAPAAGAGAAAGATGEAAEEAYLRQVLYRLIPARRIARDLVRQWKRAREAGVRAHLLHGRDMDFALEDFTHLAIEAALAHGCNTYGDDLFRALAEVPGARLLLAQHEHGLAGGFFCFAYGGTLYLWTAGLHYARLPALHTYAFLMAESIVHAARSGMRVLDAGRGNYSYKRRLGLSSRPLHTLVYLPRPDARRRQLLAAMDQGLRAFIAAEQAA
ncbi:GNAT family N-acetyltransferase [Planobispora rosea]|nr:GNAT family N-acetyltransferase [Planobispora rosea]